MKPGLGDQPIVEAAHGAAERVARTQGLALAAATFVIAAGLAAARIGHGAPDFYVFWAAARHWQAPYDPAVVAQLQAAIHLQGVWPFVYPPTFLLFVWPFAQLPLTLAYPLWTALSAALFVWEASRRIRPVWAAAALWAVPPVFLSAALGQPTLSVGAAMLAGWRLAERRPHLAGVIFALAACMKPQAMILAPIALFGNWRALGAMLAAGAALAGASLAFGLGPWLAWPHALAAFAQIAPAAERTNPSALIASPWWSAALAAFGVMFAWRNKNLLGMAAGALWLTPYAHDYDLAPLAPLAVSWLIERRRGWGPAISGGALLAGLVASPLASLAFLGSLTIFGSPLWPAARRAAADAPALSPGAYASGAE